MEERTVEGAFTAAMRDMTEAIKRHGRESAGGGGGEIAEVTP